MKCGKAISLIILLMGIFLLPKTVSAAAITSEKLIELTNKERAENGLKPLTVNQSLTQAAYDKANDILSTQTFQHNINGRKFSDWIRKTGYNYSYVGENLAIDFVTSEGVFKAWLNSPAHKQNIMEENFTEIGMAEVKGKFENNETTVVVQIFGAPPYATVSEITEQTNSIFNTINSFSLSDESLLTHSAGSLVYNADKASDNNDLLLNKNFVHIDLNYYLYQYVHLYFLWPIIIFVFCIYFYKLSNKDFLKHH